MKYTKQIIISLICGLLFLQFILKPYLHRRQADRIVKAVLTNWQAGNIPKTFEYWHKINETPPIYGLTNFSILSKSYDKKDGRRHATFVVNLNFTENNTFPSGKNWIFELQYTNIGWKITNFSQAL